MKKKLIEVALPLEAINREAAREKSIRHGHPSTLHLWWARRPLAACRAVLFASIVDDPSSHPDKFPTDEDQEKERQRLFAIIEELVKWENISNPTVLDIARKEILKATDGKPPALLDPFCGGGSIPLEAQRLGLEAHGSDLNPVAVLITKALIEIPPRFADMAPIHPSDKGQLNSPTSWSGSQGLAEDIRYYGEWMSSEAEKRIGCLYPKIKITKDMIGDREDLIPLLNTNLTIVAWFWARTVKCPNPACGCDMPLVRGFDLCTKKGKRAWVEPEITGNKYLFKIKTGEGSSGPSPKVGRGAKFKCICCGNIPTDDHIKNEGMKARMNSRLMAIVAEGPKGRIYLNPTNDQESIAYEAVPTWQPEQPLGEDKRAIWCRLYGLTNFNNLFTNRQLVALEMFSGLVEEARVKIFNDAVEARSNNDNLSLGGDDFNAQAYADSVAIYLALAVSRISSYWSNLTSNDSSREKITSVFARQAIPMIWDYMEGNPFSNTSGNFLYSIKAVIGGLRNIPSRGKGLAILGNAEKASVENKIISTDPPYFDNIGYADLSDFFYVWLRHVLSGILPDIFKTVLVPKSEELVAIPYRHKNKETAEAFFLNGMTKVLHSFALKSHKDFPVTIFYAFKQSEKGDEGAFSTGWEVFLEACIESGMRITGTWPMRTEMAGRALGRMGTNVLASSVVLVCRGRQIEAPMTTRRDYIKSLKTKMPIAMKTLQKQNIAPVDLAQSAIGPGMAIFSSYSKVVEPDGSSMRVRTALQLINQVLDEALADQENEHDGDTRWALAWFEQYGMGKGLFGDADVLARAINVSVQGVVEAGILEARGGKVRLLKRDEMDPDWDPTADSRMPIWEVTQQMILALEENGEMGAADILRKVGAIGEEARDLAYRLYSLCERKGWAQEAQAYNSLVVSWPEIQKIANEQTDGVHRDGELF